MAGLVLSERSQEQQRVAPSIGRCSVVAGVGASPTVASSNKGGCRRWCLCRAWLAVVVSGDSPRLTTTSDGWCQHRASSVVATVVCMGVVSHLSRRLQKNTYLYLNGCSDR